MAHPHSNLVQVFDNLEIAVASLAANTGILGASKIDNSREQGFRSIMQEGNIKGVAFAEDNGPILVGYANSALSLSEIEETLEADPQSSFDKPAGEQVSRKLSFLGYLSGPAAGADVSKDFVTKHRESFPEGTSITYFVYNTDTATAITANSQTVKIHIKHVGVWLRD